MSVHALVWDIVCTISSIFEIFSIISRTNPSGFELQPSSNVNPNSGSTEKSILISYTEHRKCPISTYYRLFNPTVHALFQFFCFCFSTATTISTTTEFQPWLHRWDASLIYRLCTSGVYLCTLIVKE